jgi:nitroreductase/predicted lactoylglutathione lyase
MAGIIFLKTKSLEVVSNFYIQQMDMRFWLRQANCNIFQSDQMLLGFLESEQADTQGVITFFFKSKEEVDHYYEKIKHISVSKPKTNDKYGIYHFYAKDPEGRSLEFQCFLHDLEPWQSGKCLLKSRRSIRKFQKREVSEETLNKVFELCKYAPTSRNSQSFYYVVVSQRADLDWLSTLRENASRPIANAPMAVIVVADHEKTLRKEQDACIAASYLLLSAHLYGLGTCWITAMDREEVKERFSIPKEHHIACISPIGYPEEMPELPSRRQVDDFVKWV